MTRTRHRPHHLARKGRDAGREDNPALLALKVLPEKTAMTARTAWTAPMALKVLGVPGVLGGFRVIGVIRVLPGISGTRWLRRSAI